MKNLTQVKMETNIQMVAFDRVPTYFPGLQKTNRHFFPLFKVPWPRCSVSKTANEQTPQLPRASSLITPVQQNGPSNCPDQYYLFCVQKCTMLPHCFLGDYYYFCDLQKVASPVTDLRLGGCLFPWQAGELFIGLSSW